MFTLKEQREAAYKAAEALRERIAGGDADAIKEAEEKVAFIRELDGKIAAQSKGAALLDQIGGMSGRESDGPARKNAGSPRTVGDHFIAEMKAAGRDLRSAGAFETAEFKAATDAHLVGTAGGGYGPLVTEVDREPAWPKRRRLVIADLFGSGTMSGNAITYPVFAAMEGGTGEVAEGTQKPQLHFADPTWRTDSLGEVAGWFDATDDMLDDIPYIVSEINAAAEHDLLVKEENALLAGTGARLKGVLARDGIQKVTQDTKVTVADAIFACKTKIQTATEFEADGIVINPEDYETIRLSKDSNGQYYGGGYFAGPYGNGDLTINPPLWGINTVVTSAIAKGKILVGAFSSGKVFRKGGLRVDQSNSHDKNFTADKVTFRVKERLALQIKYPAAFVELTLAPGK